MSWWTLRKLSSADPSERLEAVRGLGGDLTPAKIAALENCLGDGYFLVQLAALDRLWSGRRLRPELARQLLADSTDEVRLRALSVVTELRDPGAVGALLALVVSVADDTRNRPEDVALKDGALRALDAIQPGWREGADGARLMEALWAKFDSRQNTEVLKMISRVRPDWTTLPGAAGAVRALAAVVGDGATATSWERGALRSLARALPHEVIGALADDDWRVRGGVLAVLKGECHAAQAGALVAALGRPRSAQAAFGLLRRLLTLSARPIEPEHLRAITSLGPLQALTFADEEDHQWDQGKIGERETPITLDPAPLRELAAAALAGTAGSPSPPTDRTS